jgi:hypothetical protein
MRGKTKFIQNAAEKSHEKRPPGRPNCRYEGKGKGKGKVVRVL